MELKRHDRYDYSALPARPVYDWPGGKRLAFYVGNNIEHFAYLDGLGTDHTIVGAPQSARNYSWRDYGNRVGFFRMADVMVRLGMRLKTRCDPCGGHCSWVLMAWSSTFAPPETVRQSSFTMRRWTEPPTRWAVSLTCRYVSFASC